MSRPARFKAWLRRAAARVKVVLTAAPTWLAAASAAITTVAPELGRLAPAHTQIIATWAARLVVWIGGAILVIRRVTPVIDRAQRGLLPPGPASPDPGPAPVTVVPPAGSGVSGG